MDRLPTLFVSHGSPMLALLDSPARRFLSGLGASLPRPKAVVMVSAHWESVGAPALSLAEQPETIYDFGGFPAELSQIRYPAPGAPAVAERTATLLQQAGFDVKLSHGRGLDHGAWVPLSLMYPEADVPVFQLSLLRGGGTAKHEALGRVLAALREEGILIIGSGSMTHNLYEFWGQELDSPVPNWVEAFSTWMADRLAANDRTSLLAYRELAPFAVRNHPSEEHLMPLFVALGAAGPEARAERLHASVEYGVLAMDVYAFS